MGQNPVKKEILQLILSLSAKNNIADIITSLKKEFIAINHSLDSALHSHIDVAYRNLLVETIHQCAVKFPSVASTMVHLLMNYLGDAYDSPPPQTMETEHQTDKDKHPSSDNDADGDEHETDSKAKMEHSNASNHGKKSRRSTLQPMT